MTILVNANSDLRYGLIKKTSYALISKALDKLSDFDNDGVGLFVFPPDPELLDSAIYPGALDRPGNGIDEDGYGGDYRWQGPPQDPLAGLSPVAGKHILLIVLESGRGDVIGKTWQGQPVTPNITALAKQGTSIEYAYSHTGYTTTSIKALFNRTLSSERDTTALTDFLERSGYSLSFLSGQDESFGDMHTSTGMNRPGRYLFDARSALNDRVYPSRDPGSLRLSEERMLEQFIHRSKEVDWKQPQFFYINLQAAHFPYSHPGMPTLLIDHLIPRSKISETNRDWLESTYLNAISVADQTVGSMVGRLKKLGVYGDTIVMIIADHGESLFDDHFLGHGHALNRNQTWIPLVINRPGVRVHRAVGLEDMAELIVQLATNRFTEAEWNDPKHPVFQFVGSLQKPQLIGSVAYGEVRTILDMRSRQVFFSDLKRWEGFDEAWIHPELGVRTRTLVELWETA
ncbi:MAG: sulfatase-like hydrolase/transferase, partial [Gammaproteobacteria bacterium]|nr:sulfatase-like hydrolase/transferase [Gammaproteobacteria bacterium]